MIHTCKAPTTSTGLTCGRRFADFERPTGEIITAEAAWRDHYIREHSDWPQIEVDSSGYASGLAEVPSEDALDT